MTPEINVNEIARELKYSSNRLDAIYALLALFGKEDTVISDSALKEFESYLPQDFVKWLLEHEGVNIVFESRFMNDRQTEFGDWDTMNI